MYSCNMKQSPTSVIPMLNNSADGYNPVSHIAYLLSGFLDRHMTGHHVPIAITEVQKLQGQLSKECRLLGHSHSRMPGVAIKARQWQHLDLLKKRRSLGGRGGNAKRDGIDAEKGRDDSRFSDHLRVDHRVGVHQDGEVDDEERDASQRSPMQPNLHVLRFEQHQSFRHTYTI